MPFANNNGVKIHYEVEGQGPALLLQHGHTYSIECWYDTGFVEELGKDYRLIMVDFRGHGQSEKSYDPKDYAAETVAKDYAMILDALGITKANYYGYSMGGTIGFRSIARYALPRFSSLIIGGMTGYFESPESQRQARQQGISLEGADISKGMEDYLLYLEKRIGHLPFHDKLMKNDIRALFAYRKASAEWPYANDILSKIDVPCLLLCGDGDPYYGGARETASRMPNATFIGLPGLTHGDCIIRGDLIIPHIKKFLAEVNKNTK